MATYECEKCGMSVNATCGKCDAPLENDMCKWVLDPFCGLVSSAMQSGRSDVILPRVTVRS
jgi:hypothetical protein